MVVYPKLRHCLIKSTFKHSLKRLEIVNNITIVLVHKFCKTGQHFCFQNITIVSIFLLFLTLAIARTTTKNIYSTIIKHPLVPTCMFMYIFFSHHLNKPELLLSMTVSYFSHLKISFSYMLTVLNTNQNIKK